MTNPGSKFWNPPDVEFIFQSYLLFEGKFLKWLAVAPPDTSENMNTWSPDLVNLFLDICSTTDSISRHIIGRGGIPDEEIQIQNKAGALVPKRIGDLNVADFELNLWQGLQILDRKVVVYLRHLYPNCILSPFVDYRNSGGWWHIYNNLKHNRISFRINATTKSTLYALAALFSLLISYKNEEEFTLALYRFGWLQTGWVPESVHGERLRSPGMFWFDTKLFGAHDLANTITSDDITRISPPLASRKFQSFIGRYNPPS